MRGGRRGLVVRRFLTGAAALALAATSLFATAPPAAAAQAVPWRFKSVSLSDSLAGYGWPGWGKGWVLQCPPGYTAASGGIVGGSATSSVRRLLEYPDPADGTFHIVAGNYGLNGTTITLGATCVWAADVGTVTTVDANFARNGAGRAGGILRCPAGTTVLSGGADWSNTSQNRLIDYSTPITDGSQYGTGWYAAGYSDVSGDLAIEIRCVSSTLLTTEYAEADDSATTGAGYLSADAICALGYRILTGGAAPPADSFSPGTDQGYTSISAPQGYGRWLAHGYQPAGVTLRALALCVPASTVSLSWTQAPASLSTLHIGSITFLATDSAGEDVGVSCTVDLVATPCLNGSPLGYNLVDGSHTLRVTASNQSGYSHVFPFIWTIDGTAPTISSHSPTSDLPLAGPMTITFSEAVTGASASSITVHDETANVDAAGTVDTPDPSTATWTPNANLTPGHMYRFSLTSAIHDTAGNPLTATFFTVNAAPDLTPPTILSHSPSSGLALTGPMTITFSEPVTGVDGTSLTVHAMAANVNVAGVVARPTPTTATWTPSTRLVPGETYRFSLTTAIHDTSANPLAATSFNVRAITVVENTSAAFLEYWDRDNSSLASGGSYISSSLSGSRADLTFTATAGQTVAIYGIRLASGGYADVYLDGVRKATASFYASSTTRARVYLSGALTAGTHTISIRPLGTKPSASTGTWVGIDNALIGATVKQESSFKQAFRRTSSASASGGSYDTMIHKIDADSNVPKLQVTLVGTGVKIYGTKTTSSGSARIYVDGVLKATVSLHASATVYQALVYSGTFALGQHVIRVAAVGTSTGSTSSVGVDRITAI